MADDDAAASAPLPPWPARDAAAHKGDFGRVLVVGGSPGFTGAPGLAANAAQRGGAGLVTVVVPELCWPVVAIHCVEPMVHPLPCTSAGALTPEAADEVLRFAAGADVVVCGPGLGSESDTVACVRRLARECAAPLVLDADGLNAVAGDAAALHDRRDRVTVCTPHPGEMARLAGCTRDAVQADRTGTARTFAAGSGAVVALKGHRTVVHDGTAAWVNESGNPGMASGGTGDVLAGLVGALVGQGFGAGPATRLAVYLHGRAGDLAAAAVGDVSLVASDLLAKLPAAIQEYRTLGVAGGPAQEASLGGGEIR